MKLLWLTDIHLDHLEDGDVGRFAAEVATLAFDAAVITGDISTAKLLLSHLTLLSTSWAPRRLYFVLGNHDYYHGSIDLVRRSVADHTSADPYLKYLASGGEQIAPGVMLIGVDGWGDARHGCPESTEIMLNDFLLIEELSLVTAPKVEEDWLMMTLRKRGDREAERLKEMLATDVKDATKTVVVATHVPPFKEACWHRGKISDDDWLPYFSCKAVGDVILEAAEANPDKQYLVLCGHTHGEGIAQIRPNLVVHTGGAQYGQPAIQQVFEFNS